MTKMKKIDFKYENLLKQFKTQIDSGLFKADEKIPSEPEISREYGLSRNTIRQAMKELEIAGYIYRIQGKGTFVATAKAKSKKIAVLLYDLNYSVHPFTGKMIKGIGEAASRKAYSIEIIATGSSEDFENEILKNSSYAGFIIGSYQFPAEIVAKMIAEKIPFVFAKNYLPGLKLNAVLLDYKKAGRIAFEHLASLKHRKIALLNLGDIPISKDFTNGAVESAKKYGIEFGNENIFQSCGNFSDHDSIISRLSEFSGIITLDDETAVEIMGALETGGKKVPDDISIIGCNNMTVATFASPSLTSINMPIYELGKQAGMQLLHIIDGGIMEENIVLEPELIIRKSTQPFKSASEEVS